MTEANVTRGEFTMLAQQVTANAVRLDSIDTAGTRGVSIVQVQLADLKADVARLEKSLEQHEREHEQDKVAQAAARRRLWGAVLAVVASVDGPVLAILFSRR